MTGPGTYVYDGNGNPTTWGGTSLTFDVENRMTAYGTALTAGYRGDGLRAWKNTASGQTYFLYDGISVVCELDAGGSVIAGSTYGAAGLLGRGSVQYQFDNLGDATIRLDGSGNVLSYRLFDAWGNELSSGGEPYGYRARHGYYADGETGLIALAFRYYAPGVGRFLNRDPLSYVGGLNVFGYVASSPVARTDASGLSLVDWVVAGAFFVVVLYLLGDYGATCDDQESLKAHKKYGREKADSFDEAWCLPPKDCRQECKNWCMPPGATVTSENLRMFFSACLERCEERFPPIPAAGKPAGTGSA